MQGLSHIVRDNFIAAHRELIERAREAAESKGVAAAVTLLHAAGLRGKVVNRSEVMVLVEHHFVSICTTSLERKF